jgi:membrane protein YdbS with pleckstrin-like domain
MKKKDVFFWMAIVFVALVVLICACCIGLIYEGHVLNLWPVYMMSGLGLFAAVLSYKAWRFNVTHDDRDAYKSN